MASAHPRPLAGAPPLKTPTEGGALLCPSAPSLVAVVLEEPPSAAHGRCCARASAPACSRGLGCCPGGLHFEDRGPLARRSWDGSRVCFGLLHPRRLRDMPRRALASASRPRCLRAQQPLHRPPWRPGLPTGFYLNYESRGVCFVRLWELQSGVCCTSLRASFTSVACSLIFLPAFISFTFLSLCKAGSSPLAAFPAAGVCSGHSECTCRGRFTLLRLHLHVTFPLLPGFQRFIHFCSEFLKFRLNVCPHPMKRLFQDNSVGRRLCCGFIPLCVLIRSGLSFRVRSALFIQFGASHFTGPAGDGPGGHQGRRRGWGLSGSLSPRAPAFLGVTDAFLQIHGALWGQWRRFRSISQFLQSFRICHLPSTAAPCLLYLTALDTPCPPCPGPRSPPPPRICGSCTWHFSSTHLLPTFLGFSRGGSLILPPLLLSGAPQMGLCSLRSSVQSALHSRTWGVHFLPTVP